MAVILPDGEYAVAKKEHSYTRNSHGKPVAAVVELPLSAYLPGAAIERPDTGQEQGIEWGLRLDPSLWRVRPGDHVRKAGDERVWVVTASSLKQVLGYPDVDHIAITAVLETPEVA